MYRILDVANWFEAHPIEGWAILGIAAAVIIWLAWRYSQRQAARSRDAAALLGFAPDPAAPATAGAVDARLAELPVFRDDAGALGAIAGRRVKTISGVGRRQALGGEDLVLELDDTRLKGDSDDASMAERFRVFAARRNGRSLPSFTLRPKGMASRAGALVGAITDIEVPDYPEFSSRYVLQGTDIAAIVELFREGPAARLAETRGWHVQGDGEWLVVFRMLHLGEGGQLGEFIQAASRIADAFPQA